MIRKSFKPEIDAIHQMQLFVRQAVSETDMDSKDLMKIDLLLEEMAVNIINYGCRDMTDGRITISVERGEGTMILTLRDNGIAFNPLDKEPPDIFADIEDREVGGLGIFFVRQLTERMTYERVGDENVTHLHLAC